MEAQQTAKYLQVLQVGMVIDLTNSSRYYSADSDGTSEFEYSTSDLLTVYHRKVLVLYITAKNISSSILAAMLPGMQIPCRGRGQAPQPDAVNEFCWTITAFNQHCQHEGKALWTIVHCTHGFNRTGNMSDYQKCTCSPATMHVTGQGSSVKQTAICDSSNQDNVRQYSSCYCIDKAQSCCYVVIAAD